MTDVSSLMIMRVALSSVNCGSNENPTSVKNVVALPRSATGKLMNAILPIISLLYSCVSHLRIRRSAELGLIALPHRRRDPRTECRYG